MQRGAPALVDSLQKAQRSQADRPVGERVAEVLDDVERDRHVQAREHARGALRVDPRNHGVVLAVHEMHAGADGRALRGQARETRGERDHGTGELGRLDGFQRDRAALREADQHGAVPRHVEVRLLAAHEIVDIGQDCGDPLAMVVAVQAAGEVARGTRI